MKLIIDTDKMKEFPTELILIWCPLYDTKISKCISPRKDCGLCRDGIIQGRLASASPIKRWLYNIKGGER